MQKICERDLILFGFLSRFVLRNHIAQKAIELAEKGDFSEVIELNSVSILVLTVKIS